METKIEYDTGPTPHTANDILAAAELSPAIARAIADMIHAIHAERMRQYAADDTYARPADDYTATRRHTRPAYIPRAQVQAAAGTPGP